MPSLKFTIASIISAVLLGSSVFSAPAGTPASAAPEATQTAPYADVDPNRSLWREFDNKVTPQPIRGSLGATLLGPNNLPTVMQNPDLLAPPSTDSGSV